MKLLLDTCIWGGAVDTLVDAGQDVVWSGDWSEDPGDAQILSRAHSEGRVLVTLDKDFGELVVVRGEAHAGIVRIVGFSAREQGLAILRAVELHADELGRGALVTVEPGRMRIRPPPA